MSGEGLWYSRERWRSVKAKSQATLGLRDGTHVSASRDSADSRGFRAGESGAVNRGIRALGPVEHKTEVLQKAAAELAVTVWQRGVQTKTGPSHVYTYLLIKEVAVLRTSPQKLCSDEK